MGKHAKFCMLSMAPLIYIMVYVMILL